MPVADLSLEERASVTDRSGLPVDVSGAVWRLNDITGREKIDWGAFPASVRTDVLGTIRDFVIHMIETQSVLSAKNAFDALLNVATLGRLSDNDTASGIVFDAAFFHEMRRSFGDRAYQLHHVRRWYRWGADQGLPCFCPDAAFEIDRMRVGGNAKGQAVLSQHPEDGPLSDLEVTALLNALKDPVRSAPLTLAERAATWLCVAIGPNPIQPASMREEDVVEVPGGGSDGAFVHVQVPRMKKGHAGRRDAFRRRGLTMEIGAAVLALVRENAERRRRDPSLAYYPRALFSREKPSYMAGGPMDEYALHLTPREFTTLVSDAVAKLNVLSHRTGRPLVVSTRRLRYTYATRLIRDGASKREVADQLDHSDLQNVQCYFDVKSDIVGPLDKAMALTLGPIAQAFMGKIVGGEGKAERGGDPRSRVAVPEGGTMRPVGTCGSYGFCGLMAPVACYTCGSFQPWIDAPHHLLLERLLADRDRRVAAGRDARMVSLQDDTILAIGDVISRIEALAA